MNRKGFAPIVILLFVAAILALGGIFYWQTHRSLSPGSGATLPPSSTSTANNSTSSWQTYKNPQYGFSITYSTDQSDPVVSTNNTSSINYSIVSADGAWYLIFDSSSTPFQNQVYDPSVDNYASVTYATATQQWIVSGDTVGNSLCPIQEHTTQGVPFYVISTGFHAGDDFDAYITTHGIIAVAGGGYLSDATDKFVQDETTFSDPKSVLTVACRVVSSKKGIVQGKVLLGPTCPVERIPPDPSCAPRPYQSTIRVQSINSSAPYTTVSTDASGTFTVSLDAGTYTLQPQSQNNSTYPRCTATQVKAVAGQTQNVTLDCDTGIR